MKSKLFIEDNIGFVSLVDRNKEDAALKVVNSARISYNKKTETFTDKDKKLVSFLKENDHMSPFRHSWYTFHVKAPLFVFRQWMKYQVASYWKTFDLNGDENTLRIDEIENIFDLEKGCNWNEISYRYVSVVPEFYFPTKPRSNPPHGNKQASVECNIEGDEWLGKMKTACMASYMAYEQLLAQGLAREMARMILPQNIYSEAYWTVSLQSIIHFLEQRLSTDSQHEIRMYAFKVLEIINPDLERLGIKLK